MLKPIKFFNYSGTKTRFINIINSNIQTNKKTYIEPFVGSGAILFNLEQKFDHYIINDIDRNIIRIYKTFKEINYSDYLDVVENVFKQFGKFTTDSRNCSKLIKEQERENYYNFRNWFNQYHWKSESIEEGIYLHMYANSCINSFMRFGKNGANQSFGFKFYYIDINSFNVVKNKLQKTEIYNLSYKELLHENGFYFFDPPYLSQPSSYQGFKENDLKEFLELIKGKEFLYTDILNDINCNIPNKKLIRNIMKTAPGYKNELTGNMEYLFSSYELIDNYYDW